LASRSTHQCFSATALAGATPSVARCTKTSKCPSADSASSACFFGDLSDRKPGATGDEFGEPCCVGRRRTGCAAPPDPLPPGRPPLIAALPRFLFFRWLASPIGFRSSQLTESGDFSS